jgi:OTU-like cysteine protease
MSDDGNCLFRAISDQLYYDYGSDHAQVRSEVCDLLEAHEEEYTGFLVLDENEPDEDAKDFASYVSAMRQEGEWGGNLELVVAARLYRYVSRLVSYGAVCFRSSSSY